MDYAAFRHNREDEAVDEYDLPEPAETRAAPRFTLLIRAAKLVSSQGEFVCVIRDVSATGISVRLFHAMPSCESFALELQCGASYEVKSVWRKPKEAGFEFAEPIDVDKVVNEVGQFPRRGIRLGIHIPITIATLAMRQHATILNLSQQGARIECDEHFSLEQALRIEAPEVGEIRAKVRWRHERQYGLIFDDTFSLGDFANLAAQLQCPALLRA